MIVGATVRRLDRPHKPWQGCIRFSDGRRISKVFPWQAVRTKSQAIAALGEWREEVERPSSSRMLAEYCSAYVDEIAHGLEPSTLDGYRHSLKHVAEIGDVAVSALTSGHVARWEASMLARGLSSSTVGKAHRLLKQVCKHAVDVGDIAANPCASVKPPRRSSAGPNALDARARARLMSLLGEMEPCALRTASYIALLTGMRRGEVCALRWDDFDWDRMEVRVARSVGIGRGGAYLKAPKTETGKRTIPVPERLRTAVMASQGYVLGGETFYNPTRLGKQWTAFAKAFGIIGVEGRVATFHDLRHTYATVAIAGGADVRSVAGILGHADAAMTLNVYASADADAMRRAAEVVAASV